VLLLVISIFLAVAFQQVLAPLLVPDGKISYIPYVGSYLVECWNYSCINYSTDALQNECRADMGALRVMFASTVFFLLAAFAAWCKPTANREAWPAKYVLFLFLVAGTMFIPNTPVFSSIYVYIGRFGGMLFIVLQQVILIDMAYNWNDSWISKSNDAEIDEPGSGQKWLVAILVSCGLLFIGSLTVLIFLFHLFSGCWSNDTFISLTLVISIIVTAVQLCSEESSLLTSGTITVYATYLAYVAVSKNPNPECNPYINENKNFDIFCGIVVTFFALAWTGWSDTADNYLGDYRYGDSSLSDSLVEEESNKNNSTERREIKGVVTKPESDYGSREDNGSPVMTPKQCVQSWKLNLIMAMISCWFAMVFTGWGRTEQDMNMSKSTPSNVIMWLVISSQWFMLLLYLWTLVAPKIFPDRDFS